MRQSCSNRHTMEGDASTMSNGNSKGNIPSPNNAPKTQAIPTRPAQQSRTQALQGQPANQAAKPSNTAPIPVIDENAKTPEQMRQEAMQAQEQLVKGLHRKRSKAPLIVLAFVVVLAAIIYGCYALVIQPMMQPSDSKSNVSWITSESSSKSSTSSSDSSTSKTRTPIVPEKKDSTSEDEGGYAEGYGYGESQYYDESTDYQEPEEGAGEPADEGSSEDTPADSGEGGEGGDGGEGGSGEGGDGGEGGSGEGGDGGEGGSGEGGEGGEAQAA